MKRDRATHKAKGSRPNRRDFLRGSSAAVVAATVAGYGSSSRGQVPDGDVIRVGLVGCGGRGTGAVTNALEVDPNVRLVAVGDAFEDQVQRSLARLESGPYGDRVVVDTAHRFTGFDAYQQVIDACDVVLLATPPHFRPREITAAVEAGKHIFAEKPVAVDGPGVREVIEASKKAAERNLNLVSGLCYRYQDAKQETIQRIHDGAVGEIIALQCSYNTGGLWHRGRQEAWSDMEWQIRNWLYFTWLSGDHIAEQSIHNIDKILWVMQDEPPASCTANGGRIVRNDPKYGNVFDHFNAVFEWASGVKCFHSCRQWEGAEGDVSDYVFGTKGRAALMRHRITGENAWQFEGRPEDMYLSEHRALFGAIRAGETINNGDYMCKSTLMSIMGRMAAYTGKTVTWEQAMNSTERLAPPAYEWGDLPVAPIARPGAGENA